MTEIIITRQLQPSTLYRLIRPASEEERVSHPQFGGEFDLFYHPDIEFKDQRELEARMTGMKQEGWEVSAETFPVRNYVAQFTAYSPRLFGLYNLKQSFGLHLHISNAKTFVEEPGNWAIHTRLTFYNLSASGLPSLSGLGIEGSIGSNGSYGLLVDPHTKHITFNPYFNLRDAATVIDDLDFSALGIFESPIKVGLQVLAGGNWFHAGGDFAIPELTKRKKETISKE